MKREGGNLRSIYELEINQSYSFPTVEAVVVVFLFIAFISTLGVFGAGRYVLLRPGPEWNGTAAIESFVEYRQTMTASVYGFSALSFSHVLTFVVPLLVAFTLAGRFEDGTLHTYLSYPVDRITFLAVKVSGMIVLLGMSATFSSLSVIFIFVPGNREVFSILLLSAALWAFIMLLTSVTTLISIISKKAEVTAIMGIALWYVIALVIVMPSIPDVIRNVLNPILLTNAFVSGGDMGLQAGEVFFGICGAVLIGVVALIASIITFEKAEI